MLMKEVITLAYFSAGVIALLGYLPQITSYLKCQVARSGISRKTWGIWTVCSSIDFIYITSVVGDTNLAFFSFMQMCAVGFVFLLSFKKN